GASQAAVYHQFGFGIRTWWALIFTPPGTKFTLDLTVRCVRTGGPKSLASVDLHIDRWVWEVVVTFDSLRALIDVLHSSSIGTTEIPCIASEYFYDALLGGVDDIEFWSANLKWGQEAVMDFEGMLVATVAAEEFFIQSDFFSSSSFPPSDLGGFS